jgi:hypothetical protein
MSFRNLLVTTYPELLLVSILRPLESQNALHWRQKQIWNHIKFVKKLW